MEIERISGSGDLVRVTHSLHQRIKNFGSAPEKVKLYLHIDEWGFREPCKIISCQAKLEDGTVIKADPQDTKSSTIMV